MVNVYKHVSFTGLMPSRIRAVIFTMVLEMENSSRYNNHTNSFFNQYHEQDTELSYHIWQRQDIHPKIENPSIYLDM